MRGCAALAVATLPVASWAETLDCTLYADCAEGQTCKVAPITLSFTIDRRQFAPAISAGEPPKRTVTAVTQGAEAYPAEPILMQDGTRGFHAELPSGARLLTVAADGTARYTDTGQPQRYAGTCEAIG